MGTMYQHREKLVDVVIIGGGVAGLSAANRLVDIGSNVTLIEAGKYPSHKICGEFFSPESLPILREWNIPVSFNINTIRFFLKNTSFSFKLPSPAGSISRYDFDTLLAKRALSKGCTILTNTKVVDLNPPKENKDSFYEILLSSNTSIRAKSVIIGSGRLGFLQNMNLQKKHFFGFKAHFSGIDLKNTLEMHILPGAYLGITNIGEGKANVACITKASQLKHYSNTEEFIDQLISSSKVLKQTLSKGKICFPYWISTYAPRFTYKKPLKWNRAYFIGDGIATIYPATGDGLAMGISAGYMAAEYALADNSKLFRKAWKKRYRARLQWGKLLHIVMQHPSFCASFIRLANLFPSLPSWLYKKTREPITQNHKKKI